MQVNLLPAVRAYAEDRKKRLQAEQPHLPDQIGRIEELRMIISLVDGLEKQREVFEKL